MALPFGNDSRRRDLLVVCMQQASVARKYGIHTVGTVPYTMLYLSDVGEKGIGPLKVISASHRIYTKVSMESRWRGGAVRQWRARRTGNIQKQSPSLTLISKSPFFTLISPCDCEQQGESSNPSVLKQK